MLKADVDLIKIMVKDRDWEALKVHELPGAEGAKWSLINLAKKFFTKTGQFANPEKDGLIETREYIDYNSTIDEVIEVVKNNRREFLR